jgi:phosphate:Na+ symporter
LLIFVELKVGAEKMELNLQEMLFEFFGGLGIFLYGIKFMGDGLQKSAGDRLRDVLDRFTSNPVMGVLAGLIVTVLVQSSSATTVITVGLVSAGFMTLRQAIGVIMGANIGTTVTAFIIGINVGEYSLPIIAVGSILLFFFKNKKIHNAGQIVFGFGALFYGLELMSGGMKPLRTLESFHELTVELSSNPFLGVVIGTVFTLVVQSSSATIGILQGLHAESLINLNGALPVLFGDNIGTTITAVLAAIGTSVAAKRAAATHVLFNLIGTMLFLIVLEPFTMLIELIRDYLSLNPELTIAFAHGIFNTANTLIQLPFVAVLALIVTKLIPGEDSIIDYKAHHLDPVFIEQSTTIALGQAKEEVLRMGKFALKGLEETNEFLKTKNIKHSANALQLEEAINNLDRKITDYLIKLATSSLSEHDSEEHTMLMDTVRDIERIGDHFENIVELIEYQQANKVRMTDTAMDDLEKMFNLTVSTVEEALQALDQKNLDAARAVVTKEDEIDSMERALRKQHILRLSGGQCSGQAGIVFVDIISNLERIGDHAVNIAEYVLGEQK